MLCREYENLSHFQKVTMVGEMVHLMQIDSYTFNAFEELRQIGKMKGLLDDVKILPEQKETSF
jgi:hypothetical protein